ncbi:hypothetical protein ACJX0J_040042, partial [Zea mays]
CLVIGSTKIIKIVLPALVSNYSRINCDWFIDNPTVIMAILFLYTFMKHVAPHFIIVKIN